MKLQTKLLLHSFTFVFIALLISSFIIIRMTDMQTSARTFSDTLLKVEKLNSAVVGYQQAIDNFGSNATDSNSANAKLTFANMMKASKQLTDIPFAEQEELRRTKLILTKLDRLKPDMEAAIIGKHRAEAMMLSSKLFGVLNDIYLLNEMMTSHYTSLTKRNNQNIIYGSIASGLALLLVSTLFNMLLTRKIVKPIQGLTAYSETIASGRLTVDELEVRSKDEIGQLTQSFNVMKNKLSQLIDKINAGANELLEKNERINDSILYAKRIQDSLFPDERQLAEQVKGHFLIQLQRDLVGGDFYWYKKTERGFFAAVADCTGHGVPGALMTALSVSMLNQLIDEQPGSTPAAILTLLNRRLKQALQQESQTGLTDDGLDMALCYVEERSITFAGAKLSLHTCRNGGMVVIKGDKRSIGYRRTPIDYKYTDHTLHVDPHTIVYLSTDGLFDQNGGEFNYSYGKTRFIETIERWYALPMEEQQAGFLRDLQQYMGNRAQRDDITVLAFEVK